MNLRGKQAELQAEQFLLQQGLKLVERNYRSRYGEIDLIMRDVDTLVFVEVRARAGASFGGAAASIDTHKQRRIVRTAQHYLSALRHLPVCRFDALLLEGDQPVQWLKNAFEA